MAGDTVKIRRQFWEGLGLGAAIGFYFGALTAAVLRLVGWL